jgi:hypothetical protein
LIGNAIEDFINKLSEHLGMKCFSYAYENSIEVFYICVPSLSKENIILGMIYYKDDKISILDNPSKVLEYGL